MQQSPQNPQPSSSPDPHSPYSQPTGAWYPLSTPYPQASSYPGHYGQAWQGYPPPPPPYPASPGQPWQPGQSWQGYPPPPPWQSQPQQPVPGQFYAPAQIPTKPPRPYGGFILFMLSAVYVVAMFFLLIGQAQASKTSGSAMFWGLGMSLLLGIVVSVLMMDRRGFTTLFGWIQWQSVKGNKRLLLIGAYIFFFFVFLGVYLARAYLRSPQKGAISRRMLHLPSRRSSFAMIAGVLVTLFMFVSYAIGAANSGGSSSTSISTGTGSTSIPIVSISPTVSKAVSRQLTPTKTTTPKPGQTAMPLALTVATLTPTATPTQGATSIAVDTPTPSTSSTGSTPTSVPTQKAQPTQPSSPAPTPTPTPTPMPTQAPIPTPAPQHLFVTFTSASATDYVSGSVSVHTLPGAALSIVVVYCSGHAATSASLQGTVNADGNGNYTWTWTPMTTCLGAATATVNASLNGQTVSNSDQFMVQ